MKIIVAMDPLDSKEKSVLTAWGESAGVEIKELSERTCGLNLRAHDNVHMCT